MSLHFYYFHGMNKLSIAILFTLLFQQSAWAQLENEHHQADEVVSKKELNAQDIAIIDALVKRNTEKVKEKGSLDSKYTRKITGWSGKKIYHQKVYHKDGKRFEDIRYPTVGLHLKKEDGKVVFQHYKGFMAIDTTRDIEIATFEVDKESDTYHYTTEIYFNHPLEKIDLYMRYKGDSTWKPIGKHGKYFESLIAFDPIPMQRFLKYKRLNRIGNIFIIGGAIIAVPMILHEDIGLVPGVVTVGITSLAGILIKDKSERFVVEAADIYNALIVR